MLFDPNHLLLLAGPCSLENERVCRAIADTLQKLRRTHPELKIVFKGSFDKANRTSLAGDRGPRLEEGLGLLAVIKKDYGFPVVTDFHERQQPLWWRKFAMCCRFRRSSAGRPICCLRPQRPDVW